MSRTVALLALAQVATVICGFFGLSIILRRYGYPEEPNIFSSGLGVYHWSHLTLFLRRYGFILLIVPLSWAAFAAISERRASYILSHGLWLVVGTIIPFTIIMTFLYAIFHPCIAVPN